jgi:hypothetical protein
MNPGEWKLTVVLLVPVLAALFTSGCVTSTLEPSVTTTSQTTAGFGRELDDYIRCNANASRMIAAQPGDPISLAISARGICLRAETTLSEAIFAVHRPELARKLIEQTRESAVEVNASTIVKTRALRQQ